MFIMYGVMECNLLELAARIPYSCLSIAPLNKHLNSNGFCMTVLAILLKFISFHKYQKLNDDKLH